MSHSSKLPADSPLLRFGPKAEVLAEALHMMSLSLVKMVLDYLISPTATPGAKPKLLFTLGSDGDGDGQFSKHVGGAACSPDNKIWTASYEKVQVFREDGKFLHYACKGLWKDAAGIAFTADGQLVYITDYKASCIVVCRPDGSFVRKFGSYGVKNGEFICACHIAIDSKHNLLFVTDEDNHRVQVLTLDGTFFKAFGGPGSGNAQFIRPRGVAINSAGLIGVCDNNNDRIQVFDRYGEFLYKFGGHGSKPGQLEHPFGLCVDSADNWVVADTVNHRVCVFASDGTFLTAFGEHGSREGFLQYPYGCCVDNIGRIFVDVGSGGCMLVFGFPQAWI